jgi:hypothetical protein
LLLHTQRSRETAPRDGISLESITTQARPLAYIGSSSSIDDDNFASEIVALMPPLRAYAFDSTALATNMNRSAPTSSMDTNPARLFARLPTVIQATGLGRSTIYLIDELATVALANYDAQVRFEARAARGNAKRALTLFERLDRAG